MIFGIGKKEESTLEEALDALTTKLNQYNNKIPCKENGVALHHLTQAREALAARTQDRIRRGVEGKHVA